MRSEDKEKKQKNKIRASRDTFPQSRSGYTLDVKVEPQKIGRENAQAKIFGGASTNSNQLSSRGNISQDITSAALCAIEKVNASVQGLQ